MSLLEIESIANTHPLGFELPAIIIANQLPDADREAYLRDRWEKELLLGKATMFIALRTPVITAAVLDIEWGPGTREGLLHDISDEEALALRLFMGNKDIVAAEAAAREIFSHELPTELEMTQT